MDIVLRRTLRKFTGLFKQILINLLSEDGEVWEQEFKKFLRKEQCWVKPAWNDLIGFFMTCSYLEVYGGFMESILRPASCVGLSPKATVGVSYNLDQSMPSHILRRKLGDNHVFENAYAFCVYFAEAIQLQHDGRSGDFLVDGQKNIFFVRVNFQVYAVTARWRGARHGTLEWSIDTTAREVDWNEGDRAFPCADTRAV